MTVDEQEKRPEHRLQSQALATQPSFRTSDLHKPNCEASAGYNLARGTSGDAPICYHKHVVNSGAEGPQTTVTEVSFTQAEFEKGFRAKHGRSTVPLLLFETCGPPTRGRSRREKNRDCCWRPRHAVGIQMSTQNPHTDMLFFLSFLCSI